MVRLQWWNRKLMLNQLALGEVREAGMMSGHLASVALPGMPPVVVASKGSWSATNDEARRICEARVLEQLAAVGIEAEVLRTPAEPSSS